MKLILGFVLVLFIFACLKGKPDITQTPKRTSTQLVQHKPMSKATRLQFTKTEACEDNSALRRQLQDLLEHHPTPGIRTVFFAEIKNGSIATSWADDRDQLDAAFALVPKQLVHSDQSHPDLIPILIINPKILNGSRDWANMVIFHEYIHYTQWKNGKIPADTFVYERTENTREEEWCPKKWYAELEAYHKECLFAQRAGTAKLLPWCAQVGPSSYKNSLKQFVRTGDGNASLCAPFWNE